MQKNWILYGLSAIVLLAAAGILSLKSGILSFDTPEKQKYSKHPQKFDNPDPELQRQWEDLKEVLCDNEHMKYYKIMIGRNVNISSILEVMTTGSTDLTNIWSHLLFGIYFLFASFHRRGRFFWLFIITSYTYFMSACYHIFRNYSRTLYDIFLCFDVSSIGIQIFSYNIVDTISFFSKRRPDLKKIYLTIFISFLIITTASIPIILHYKFYTFRTVLFSFVATIGFGLIYHGYKVQLTQGQSTLLSMIYYRIISYLLQGVGIFFRGSHIPERYLPDTVFQEYFHSHFWFHIAAAIGSVYACKSSEILAAL